ncbi:MAG: hypothetical protein J7M34_12215 [Anaerolineae bacterium]|nr:hypothetical protein [Anaerolineae bacterium]
MHWGKDWDHNAEILHIIRRTGNGIVPVRVSLNRTIWESNRDYFATIFAKAPDVSITLDQNPAREHENESTDAWGCRWHYPGQYLDGQVVSHPLDDWSKWRTYRSPDPADYTDWDRARADAAEARRKGQLVIGHIEHGFFYLRLSYLRGFENLMLDIADNRPELHELIAVITDYWAEVVRRWIEIGVDMIVFGDDLGHQNALPMRPDRWRDLILPTYRRLFAPCREHGIEVYLHTDGYIVDIIPDLIAAGVTVLNPQDLVNGLGSLKRLAWGKTTLDLDIDRQHITVFGTPAEIREHIANCIRTLGSPRGGLMLIYGAYPGTPVENIGAVIQAMQEYHTWWCDKSSDQG